MIGQDKREALKRRMVSLGILEDDLIERFIRGTGHGGQKINKTSSCVYLQHQPSGIEIKCQAQRSREMNRFLARREICDRIEEIEKGRRSKRQQQIEKIRRQKRRRSRRQRQRDVGLKRQHGQKKELRRRPGGEES
ncbi:MAG: peptide chain release factor-like protein [Verrucomicrobia bacterium]|nr:peptide chain release factor-like protein [Roseibacillus sp.]RCL38656.1 MAG: peptide chain release factor-like protein [Verrucomicrobiota bacterium]